MMASLVLLAQVALSAAPGGLPFEHTQNVVYGEAHGVGLIMDVFVPRGEKNGAAIIDVVSGAWYADRGKLAEHWAAGMYEFHCARGFTVFAVRPGSVSHFTGEEMLAHIRTALKFVRGRAAEYGIDPQRIGLVGASAGGHLATLAAVTAAPEDRVQAVAVFFPPTDFLDWNSDGQMPDFEEIGPLLFADSLNGRSEEDIRAKAAALSPARQVGENPPPCL
ncbi:MAG TPA: alpha/beta hydrolase fold domain-containing protein, partial [Candidatus Hydrogenedentes bacterium]|nr:alpha/beta hydrolase fold domain-containing protein [Candidatus Hydrogenedentota bacterium]